MSLPSKIAVIGSTSFIGSHFAKTLEEKGIELLRLDRSAGFDYGVTKDIFKVMNALNAFKPSVIINYASQSLVDPSWDFPSKWYSYNLTAQVFLHAKLLKVDWLDRFIQFSTPEVYGNIPEPVKETQAFNPTTPYAISRAACDFHLRALKKQYGYPINITRAANVYGPGQKNKIIPIAIEAAKENKTLKLQGGGKSLRSFVFIDDITDATLRIIENALAGEEYHLSSNKLHSIREVVEQVGRSLEVKIQIKDDVERRGKDHCYNLDSSKAVETLGWSPKVNLSEGIGRTIRGI